MAGIRGDRDARGLTMAIDGATATGRAGSIGPSRSHVHAVARRGPAGTVPRIAPAFLVFRSVRVARRGARAARLDRRRRGTDSSASPDRYRSSARTT